MLQNGIAVPSFASGSFPCILVPKHDKTPRFCTDMRKVNSVTKTDLFPLPRMDDCIDLVKTHTRNCVIYNSNQAFIHSYAVRVKECSRSISADNE